MPTFYRPALFAASAAAALFAVVSPDAVFAQNAPTNTGYDVKAEAVLQRAADRLKAAQTFSGQVLVTNHFPATDKAPARETRSISTFRLQKPNLVFHEVGNQKKNASGTWVTTPSIKYVTDGKTGVALFAGDKTYEKRGVTSDAITRSYGLNFPEFFDSKISDAQQARESKASGALVSLQTVPDETFGGVACAVVQEKTTASTTKIYVGKKDDIVRGYHSESPSPAGSGDVITLDTVVSNVVVGDKIPASVFAVNVTGYKPYVAPERPKLLAAGTVAPDFTAYDKDGKAIKLSDFKGKIVVLDFWATWCGPCMQSLPGTTDVARKYADKGVVVLAVDVWDKKEAFDKWLPQHPEYAPLQFVIDTTPGQGQDVATKLYHVWGIPTQYVIRRNGTVAASLIYRPKAELEKALVKAE